MYSQFEMETTMKIDEEFCKSEQQSRQQNGVIEPLKNEEEGQKWSNFQDCDKSVDDKFQEFSKTKLFDAGTCAGHINNNKHLSEDKGDIDFSNFASFGDQNIADDKELLAEEDEFDDFDDFVSASQPIVSEPIQTIEPNPTKSIEKFRQLPKTEKQLADILKETFHLDEGNIASSAEENTISSNIFEHVDSVCFDIWEHLQKIDVSAFGFHDRWRESESFNLLLNALKIDKHLVVRCFIIVGIIF